ncbi:hypothetical protein [Abyssisolibacter fermentans]|nr:hypothetical protein [Abyssisolibacter fermentans]
MIQNDSNVSMIRLENKKHRIKVVYGICHVTSIRIVGGISLG